MKRWIPLIIGLLLPAAAGAAVIMVIPILSIDWGGGVVSTGNMKASGLPAAHSAGKKTRTRPGERVNRPDFGAGSRDMTFEPNSRSRLPTGKRRHKPITIVKPVDKASAMLRRAHATRRPLRRVVITGRDSSGGKVKWVIVKVHVTAWSASGSGVSARERVSFTYDRISWD